MAQIGAGLGGIIPSGQAGSGMKPKPKLPPKNRAGGAVERRIGGNSSGKNVRPAAPPSTSPGPIAPVNAAPSVDQFLGTDTDYQGQLAQFAKLLQDFTADATRRKGSLESEYGLSERALNDQRGVDLKKLEDDFGARGLVHSGLYGKAVGDYEGEFGKRMSDLSRRQQEALAALLQEQNQFTSQQELQKQAAREGAISRRAAQYGA